MKIEINLPDDLTITGAFLCAEAIDADGKRHHLIQPIPGLAMEVQGAVGLLELAKVTIIRGLGY